MKITGNENSVWNLQRDELLQCWNFREFISWILCNMSIASGKKKDKVSIAIAPSNFTFFSVPKGSILCPLFLPICIKNLGN